MAAYLIGRITIHDPDLWGEYVAGVAESLKPFPAEVLFRGEKAAVLAGEEEREFVVAIRFPDQEILNRWFASESYQSLIPIRDRAADVTIATYDELA